MSIKKVLKKMMRILPDKWAISLDYYRLLGEFPNLKNPKTFNEKLQWLKLYNRNPEYTTMVDKYAVKQYVAERIGAEFVVPTYGVWERFDDIDFDALPDRFVLKCTHDSGGLVICKDKTKIDKTAAKKKLENSLKTNYFWQGREWPYKNVKPRIIAEQLLEDSRFADLRDYKFFCFNGEAKALFVASERHSANAETKFDFFDMDFQHMDVRNGHPNADILPEKPASFETMRALAEKLSEGHPHMRVDFYEVDGKTYFGELTLFHWSGMVPFEPKEWDRIFGDWIKLPEKP